MSSLLRLLLPKSIAPGTRNVQRDTVALAMDDGSSIDVLRVRDPRARRVRLSVDERGARLTLPPRASLDAGERFLREHSDWLQAQLRAHAIDHITPLQRGVTDALPLRGELLPLRWERGRFACVVRDADGLVFRDTARGGGTALRRALREFYESEARADVGRWLPGYLPGLPRAPARMRLKPMSSQWGSLAPDGTLALDLALVLGRPSAFEYVLVHELCHLLRPDHSPAFWHEVEARCPDWRAERDYFRSEGRQLKAALRVLLSGDTASPP
ncbi:MULTISPECIES: SprT family zinc-dependent metalloprotease [unclassified Luteimonas]|uniref:YgjP family zinc-dependent metalloprotease n=1 Tax=unclassified Luteimonas TaxID=2629088 RepID=UPI0018F091BA|nr:MULTISPECIES: SprT family zinc-dependent metalloprotease [unclassified Luteimonas]MBJ6981835.1 M48 family metallopeptidase [Luteimonas sp. MC1572]MBJ7575602.1 M48 family metallopeptidase [Luteimonas sp. MC1828]QQO03117.1 M48 family metallopeptidase [Luteimonas sp. MC1572]